jgi:hypothetical protein
MLYKPFFRPQIAQFLLGLRDELGYCHSAVGILLDPLVLCLTEVEWKWPVAGNDRQVLLCILEVCQ